MTLNGVIALIMRFFTEFDCFAGQLCHNVRKILFFSSSLPLLAITNPPCSAVSAIAELLVIFCRLQTRPFVYETSWKKTRKI